MNIYFVFSLCHLEGEPDEAHAMNQTILVNNGRYMPTCKGGLPMQELNSLNQPTPEIYQRGLLLMLVFMIYIGYVIGNHIC